VCDELRELPAVAEWKFGPEQAAALRRPVLSVIGAETRPLWLEIAELLRTSLPQVEECTIDGAGHLLQIQRREPVARGIAGFLRRNALAAHQVHA
jgi:3-oxoadipate enol-lactonase